VARSERDGEAQRWRGGWRGNEAEKEERAEMMMVVNQAVQVPRVGEFLNNAFYTSTVSSQL